MRWKQFLTPIKSIDSDQARELMADKPPEELTILDVRQPNEYEEGHIPGTKLIPLPDLTARLDEIDPNKPTLVYWAMGGRSRVAAQMLEEKGFGKVYNLSGGFKGWKSEAAFGSQDLGLELFTGDEAPEKTLVVAYSLEEGLCDFYLSMIKEVKNNDVKNLFQRLSAIEIKHQDRIYSEYITITGVSASREEFEKGIVSDVAEGGLTTDEYINFFQPDLESAKDIIDLAMSIEAQALDLYMRAADRSGNPQSKKMLMQIADEERMHLTQLGKLMEGF